MSIRCRLKGKSHGDDGKKASALIDSMQSQIEIMKSGLNAIANPQILSSHGDPEVLRDYARKILDSANNPVARGK